MVKRVATMAALVVVISFFVFNVFLDSGNENLLDMPVMVKEMIKEEGVEGYFIYIDLTESMLYLFKDGELYKKYPVAYGKKETPSPIGVWRIVYKAKNWGTGFGTRWMGLDVPWGIYGIHGTNKPGSIGSSVSHGCVRMFNRNVEELYDLVPYNTIVVISGGPYGNLGSNLRILSPGDRNSHVLEVQKRLKALGYYDGGLDGIYGEGMKSALIHFKKDYKLPMSDKVDYETYKALKIYLFE